MVNILSFIHPHAESLFNEGLWGFPDDKTGTNRKKWSLLEPGTQALIYGEHSGTRGVWFLCEIAEKFENRKPVKYWVQNPTGYPWQIKLKPVVPYKKLDRKVLDKIKPIRKEELASVFGIRIFRAKLDRWSLMLFGEPKEPLITYNYAIFRRVAEELELRNKGLEIEKPDHDLIKEAIYQIGLIQNRYSVKEYPIDSKYLDIVWRRTIRSVPAVAFEIQIGGNLFEALSKLKHAFDLWNSIPILITTGKQLNEARKWIEGSFHELKDKFRVLTWEEIKEYYDVKRKAKNLETKLGIS